MIVTFLIHYNDLQKYISFLFFSVEAEKLEAKALKNINKCSKTVNATGLETTAYLRALAESKGLNIDKHRTQLENQMKKDIDDEGTMCQNDVFLNFELINMYTFCCDC